MKSLSLTARIRIAASLLVVCGVAGVFPVRLPSRTFFRHVASGSIVLAASPASVRTYKEGSRLYIDNGTIKVGVETNWGGAIVEVIWHGMNFVNAYDTGREVQAAVYDGDPYPPCGDCKGAMGWDPVQAGDSHKHGSPVIAQTLGEDSIYTKAQPYHWFPDNKGGGPDKPVSGDVYIEQWVSLLRDYPSGIKVRYKITHFGNDQHVNSFQEFPAVYVNWEFGRFVYYGGETPWTNGPVTFQTMPDLPKSSPHLYAPELWGAFVNDQGIGLAAFIPGQYPYFGGFDRPPTASKNSGTHYFSPRAFFSFGPNSVLEGDIYLFGGDYREARQAIYSLHKSLADRDVFAPYGVVDQPARDAKCTGPLNVSGWAIHARQVSEVDVLLDDHLVGHAKYGLKRPDLARTWSHAPEGAGFWYTLDTTQFPDGKHILGVNAKDAAGNVAVFSRIPVFIDNRAQAAKPK